MERWQERHHHRRRHPRPNPGSTAPTYPIASSPTTSHRSPDTVDPPLDRTSITSRLLFGRSGPPTISERMVMVLANLYDEDPDVEEMIVDLLPFILTSLVACHFALACRIAGVLHLFSKPVNKALFPSSSLVDMDSIISWSSVGMEALAAPAWPVLISEVQCQPPAPFSVHWDPCSRHIPRSEPWLWDWTRAMLNMAEHSDDLPSSVLFTNSVVLGNANASGDVMAPEVPSIVTNRNDAQSPYHQLPGYLGNNLVGVGCCNTVCPDENEVTHYDGCYCNLFSVDGRDYDDPFSSPAEVSALFRDLDAPAGMAAGGDHFSRRQRACLPLQGIYYY